MWIKDVEMKNSKDIYDVWHIVKFLCQEIDRKESDQIGKRLAQLSKPLNLNYIESFRQQVMMMLRRPSTLPKIKQSLWKNYVYYKRKSGNSVSSVKPPEELRGITAIAKELLEMERAAFEDGTFFGPSPILYRSKQQLKYIQNES